MLELKKKKFFLVTLQIKYLYQRFKSFVFGLNWMDDWIFCFTGKSFVIICRALLTILLFFLIFSFILTRNIVCFYQQHHSYNTLWLVKFSSWDTDMILHFGMLWSSQVLIWEFFSLIVCYWNFEIMIMLEMKKKSWIVWMPSGHYMYMEKSNFCLTITFCFRAQSFIGNPKKMATLYDRLVWKLIVNDRFSFSNDDIWLRELIIFSLVKYHSPILIGFNYQFDFIH